MRSSLIFWIFLAYAGAIAGHLAWQTAYDSGSRRETRGFFLQHALRVSKPLLREGRTRELSAYLREAVEMGLIDFYELEVTEKPIETAGAGPGEKPALAEPVSLINGWIWGKAETTEISVRIASGVGWQSRFHAALAAKAESVPADLAFFLLAASIILFFQGKVRRPPVYAHAQAPRDTRITKVLRVAAEQPAPAAPREQTTSFEGVVARLALLPGASPGAHSHLESFFADCAGVVTRYSGIALGPHGHELLYYFPGSQEPAVQARLALSVARDLEALAAAKNERLAIALACGTLRVANGNALFGAPVQECGDLLRVILQSQKAATKATQAFAKLGASLEKGPAIGTVLADCKRGQCQELAYYRSDEAIAETLRSLAAEEGWEQEAYVATMNALRQVECGHAGLDVIEAFRRLLAAELARKDSYRLSSTLALAPHLLNRAAIDKPLEGMFLEAVKVRDRRVRANAVEVFTKFFPEREIPELKSLLRDEDNRVSANALIKAACERFDEKVIMKLEERVKGGSVAHVASALHAIGEIAAYYKRTDPLFLASKISFLHIFAGIGDLVRHPNPMIRRQALIAAQKLGDPAVDEKLHHLFGLTSDPELLSLFATVYGWRKPEAHAAA